MTQLFINLLATIFRIERRTEMDNFLELESIRVSTRGEHFQEENILGRRAS